MRRTTRASVLSLVAMSLLLAANAVAGGKGKDEENIRVRLKGFEEVPVVVTGASGDLRLAINQAAGTIAYDLTYENLQGIVTQAHIHIGQSNVNGGIAIWLCQTAGSPAPDAVKAITPVCPNTNPANVSGTLTATNVIGPTGQLVAPGELGDVLLAIRAGKAYGNVHSNLAPGGEVRGQLHH